MNNDIELRCAAPNRANKRNLRSQLLRSGEVLDMEAPAQGCTFVWVRSRSSGPGGTNGWPDRNRLDSDRKKRFIARSL